MNHGWQDIDSAPKDGTAIWVKGTGVRSPYQCWAVYKDGNWVCLSAEQFVLHDLYEWLPGLT